MRWLEKRYAIWDLIFTLLAFLITLTIALGLIYALPIWLILKIIDVI